jgi:hypothetical protein
MLEYWQFPSKYSNRLFWLYREGAFYHRGAEFAELCRVRALFNQKFFIPRLDLVLSGVEGRLRREPHRILKNPKIRL